MATRNLTMSRPTRQQTTKPTVFKPHELAARDVIASLDKGVRPDVAGIELENLKTDIDILIEAFESGSYQDARPSFLKCHTRLASLVTSTPDQDTAKEDKRFTTGKNGKKVLKLASIADIYALPDPEYLITNILETASVSLIYGVSGTGKTFTCLNLALCIAHGIPWNKREVKQGIVLYVNTEGGRGLKKRLKAWYMEHPELSPSPNFKVIPWSLDLKENLQDLIDTIEDLDESPILIILDNFSMCAPGVDQNKQEDVTRVLAPLHMIATEYGVHIMVVHHTNKEGDVNGTMAFRNHVDTMIELKKEDKADRNSPIIFHSMKARDDEEFSDIKTELKQVVLYADQKTHKFVSSCVAVLSETPIKQPGLPDTQQNMLDLLGDEPQGFEEWKKLAIAELKIVGRTFERHAKALHEQGYVKKVKVEGKRCEQYVRVTPAEQSNGDDEP